MATARRHWGIWVLTGLGVLLLITVAGPFAYIHFIEGKAPAPLTVTSTKSGAGKSSGGQSDAGGQGSAAVPLDGTWKVASGSQAGYRVKEILFGQDNTAAGRTSSVTGQVTITGTQVTAASLTADLTSVSSDQSRRDSQFQGRIMDTADFPTATFALTSPLDLGAAPPEGTTIAAKVTGNLTLRGTTRSVTFTVTAKRSGASIQASGQIPVTFSDFNIPNPSFGPVTTQDNGILEFLVVLSHA